jgi:hypothetical protein
MYATVAHTAASSASSVCEPRSPSIPNRCAHALQSLVTCSPSRGLLLLSVGTFYIDPCGRSFISAFLKIHSAQSNGFVAHLRTPFCPLGDMPTSTRGTLRY